MKLVQFEDGSYGVRSHWSLLDWGWKFYDLENPRFSWYSGDIYFYCCKGSKEEALECIDLLTKNIAGKHKVVK